MNFMISMYLACLQSAHRVFPLTTCCLCTRLNSVIAANLDSVHQILASVHSNLQMCRPDWQTCGYLLGNMTCSYIALLQLRDSAKLLQNLI